MFERFRNRDKDGDGYKDDGGGVATRERDRDDDGRDRHRGRSAAAVAAGGPVGGRVAAHEMRSRQRDEFGGINWGSAFFGWLVAVGMVAILAGILAAAGAAIGLTKGVSTSDAAGNADTISLAGGILLLVVLLIAYYCGGYVAGRMSRFWGVVALGQQRQQRLQLDLALRQLGGGLRVAHDPAAGVQVRDPLAQQGAAQRHAELAVL